jgi:hypothetical protein
VIAFRDTKSGELIIAESTTPVLQEIPVAGSFSIQRLTAAWARPLDDRECPHDKNPWEKPLV